MAKSRRRDEDAVDGRLDDVLDDDVLDEDELDEDELDADLVDDDELDAELVDTDDDEESDAGRSRTATRRRAAGSAKKVGVTKKSTWTRDLERVGVFARLRNFVREVVAELRKVIWPTRKELLTYTAVVIVFVTIMFSIVASLDYGFGKAMFLIFGNKK